VKKDGHHRFLHESRLLKTADLMTSGTACSFNVLPPSRRPRLSFSSPPSFPCVLRACNAFRRSFGMCTFLCRCDLLPLRPSIKFFPSRDHAVADVFIGRHGFLFNAMPSRSENCLDFYRAFLSVISSTLGLFALFPPFEALIELLIRKHYLFSAWSRRADPVLRRLSRTVFSNSVLSEVPLLSLCAPSPRKAKLHWCCICGRRNVFCAQLYTQFPFSAFCFPTSRARRACHRLLPSEMKRGELVPFSFPSYPSGRE